MPATKDFHQAFVRLRSHTSGEWFVSPDLRPKLVEQAQEEGTNLTEVAVKILCHHYGLSYEPHGRKTAPRADDTLLNLRLPVKVYQRLVSQYGTKYQDGIRAILCAHFGLRIPAPVKRGRAAA